MRRVPLLAFLLLACPSPPAPLDDDDTLGDDDAADDDAVDDDDSAATEAPVVVTTFTEIREPILNPERGFYGWSHLLPEDDYAAGRARGWTLYYADVELTEWRDAPIPFERLEGMVDALDNARAAGVKLIVRFNYTGDIDGEESRDDAPLARVREHIDQVALTLFTYRDVVLVVQAGFIGAWGEWHSSTSGNDTPEARADVLYELLDATPEVPLAVRTPGFKAEILGDPVEPDEAWSSAPVARVGHHNDCFLASETDVGTYPEGAIETWKAYVEADGAYTSVGGEACGVNPPRSSCASALAEMERLHWVYLNASWHPDVLQAWRDEGCMDEIVDRLGYRFVLDAARVSEAVAPGGVLRVEVALRNTGFGGPVSPRPVQLVLRGAEEVSVGWVDARPWRGDVALSGRFRVPSSLPEGDYEVGLRLPEVQPVLADRPEYSIRFANDDVWDGTGLNVLGSLEVRAGVGVDVLPDAPRLELIRGDD